MEIRPKMMNYFHKMKSFFIRFYQKLKVIDQQKFIKGALVGIGAVFALLAFFVVAYYIIFPSRGYFHSDSTDTLMWAQSMYDAKWIYNLDFEYAGYLPFGGSLLMIIFIPFFGVSMTTHVLGMLLFFILLFLALIGLFRSLNFNWFYTGLSLFMVSFGIAGSEKIREIFFGHVIYYSLGVLFFIFGLNLIFRLEKLLEKNPSYKQKRFILLALLTFVFYLLASLNGFHSLILFSLPVTGGYVLERLFRNTPTFFHKENISFFIILGIVSVGILLGTAFNIKISTVVTQGYADAYSSYSAPSVWADNLMKFIEQWFTLYGVNINAGEPMKSVESVLNLIRIASGTLILVVPFVALAKYKTLANSHLKVLVLAHAIMTLLLMIGYVFGYLSSAFWRLSPLLGTSLVVSVAYFKPLADRLDLRRVSIVFITPLLITGMITLSVLVKMPHDYNLELGKNDCYIISRELQAHDLEYGYANFWHANVVTVVSNSKVKVRSINDDFLPYYYQGNHSWYEDQEGVETYFLLLNEAEYYKASRTLWYQNEHTEFIIEGSEDYHVLVFSYNLY